MSMLRITQLEMQQIGPFGDLTLEFPEKPDGMEDKAEIHILTGENGTGKSTVLEAMAVLFSQGTYRHSNKFHLKKDLLIKISLSEVNNLEAESIIQLRKTGGVQHVRGNDLIAQRYVLPYNDYETYPFGVAFFAYSGHRRFDIRSKIDIKDINSHPFEHALDFQKSISHENILQWIANNITKSLVAQGKGNGVLAQSFVDTIEKLEKAISSIIQKDVKFQLEESDLKILIQVSGEELEFNQLPDGLKSIISWISDILMRMDRVKWENDIPVFERNFILFLDEIEVHMHPAWQRKILPVVQRLFPNAQIFISTHSPFVVGSVDGAWIHKLVKPNGDSKLAEGYPKLSEDGNSFRYWLDEVFDVSAEFGIGAENQLKEFYKLRDKVLKSDDDNLNKELINKGRELAEQSAELHQIIEMELRQVNRRKSLSLSI